MAEGPRKPLTEKFPDAGADAVDLLSKMLTFDPASRISVRDAMRHPWLARFHQVRACVRACGGIVVDVGAFVRDVCRVFVCFPGGAPSVHPAPGIPLSAKGCYRPFACLVNLTH